MRTTGGPAPDVSTCRDSVAATGTLKLWRSAVSASSATVRSQTIVPSGFEPRQEIYVEIPGSLQPSTWLRALWELICEAVAVAAVPGAGGPVGPGPLARAPGSARRLTPPPRQGPTRGQSGDRHRAEPLRATHQAPADPSSRARKY